LIQIKKFVTSTPHYSGAEAGRADCRGYRGDFRSTPGVDFPGNTGLL